LPILGAQNGRKLPRRGTKEALKLGSNHRENAKNTHSDEWLWGTLNLKNE
jgi:hypothetical protein